MPRRLALYYALAKPGIVRGNLLPAAAGFLLGSHGTVQWGTLAALLGGTALVISSACVCNNYLDRDIDQKMARTKQRALAAGSIKPVAALLYASALGLAGFGILSWFTNTTTVVVGAIAFVLYVAVYDLWKRHSPLGTLVGSIPGAAPPVAGYVAASHQLDSGALLLFLLLVCWQMAHFYAIAVYRLDDYKAANIPVLPLQKGVSLTKLRIIAYIAGLLAVMCLLASQHFISAVGLAVMAGATALWLTKGLRSWHIGSDQLWAKRMFLFSLVVMGTMSMVIGIEGLLK